MKVDHVLILAAGKGTRMGSVGKVLPKVIWPVFNKSILELEVLYAKEYSADANVYINLYNHKKALIEYTSTRPAAFDGIKLIIEEDQIDIGGAVHNLAKQLNYKGVLLILNSDQFLFSKKELLGTALKKLKQCDSVLFTYEINQADGYSALKINNERLQGIISNSDLKNGASAQTYTGMSLINLERLEPTSGKSSFFSSVANPSRNNVQTIEMKNLEYWDFGTVDRYHKSMFKVLKNPDSQFYKFLVETNTLLNELNSGKSYNSSAGINLTGKTLDLGESEICLKGPTGEVSDRDRGNKNIICGDLLECAK